MSVEFDVLGAGAFREVGRPTHVETAGDRVAVAGSLGNPQWAGASLEGVVGGAGWERVSIYDRSTLECSLLVPLRWPVHDLAFDPTANYLAIGTGSYDGGWFYEGELVLIDLRRREVVSLLREKREVLEVAWSSDGSLDLLVSPATDEDLQEPEHRRIPHSLWIAFERRSISLSELEAPASDPPRSSGPGVVQELGRIASDAGQSHEVRRQVWDVHVDETGEVLACLEGVRLESWATATHRRVAVATEGRGCQLEVLSDTQVLTVVEHPWDRSEPGFARTPGSVEILDRQSGEQLRPIDVSFPSASLASTRGHFMLRNVDWRKGSEHTSLFLSDAEATPSRIGVGGYDLFNHPFRIRRSPEILLLVGEQPEPWREKWIACIESDGHHDGRNSEPRMRRKFPLEWDAARAANIMGGPGVCVDDARGTSLLHAGWIRSGAGLRPDNSFLVRRSYASGALEWEYRASAQFSGVDVIDGDVWATLMSGELVRLDAASGEVLDETALEVSGHPVVPLSLSASIGWLAIGLLDGRILRIEI